MTLLVLISIQSQNQQFEKWNGYLTCGMFISQSNDLLIYWKILSRWSFFTVCFNFECYRNHNSFSIISCSYCSIGTHKLQKCRTLIPTTGVLETKIHFPVFFARKCFTGDQFGTIISEGTSMNDPLLVEFAKKLIYLNTTGTITFADAMWERVSKSFLFNFHNLCEMWPTLWACAQLKSLKNWVVLFL